MSLSVKIGTSVIKIICKASLPLLLQSELLQTTGEELVDRVMEFAEEKGIMKADSLAGKLEKILADAGMHICEEHRECILQQISCIFTEELVIPTQYYLACNANRLGDFLVGKYMELPAGDREYEGEVKCILRAFAPDIIEARSKGIEILEDIIAEIKICREQEKIHEDKISELSGKVQQLSDIIENRIVKTYVSEGTVAADLAEEFYRYWDCCEAGQNLKEREELEASLIHHKRFIAFLENTYESGRMMELCTSVSGWKAGRKPALPYSFCIGSNREKPLFYAQALLWRAQICISIYRQGRKTLSLLYMARSDLESAESIVQAREYDERLASEVIPAAVQSGRLYGEICLAEAEVYAREALALKEPIDQPEVLLREYIKPCTEALSMYARIGSDHEVYEKVKQLCSAVFFTADSIVLSRVQSVLYNEASACGKLYLACRNLVLEAEKTEKLVFPGLNSVRSREEFYYEPVYSAAFDSVTGNRRENMDQMELTLFQLAASSKTLLLQPPQIIDNANMLRLMHKESFRSLCRNEIVVCSTFSCANGTLAAPKEYLLRNLKKKDFVFSSLPCLSGKYGARNREIVAEALEQELPFSAIKEKLDEVSREEIGEIYDSYRVAFELFPDYRIMRYHQNPARRTRQIQLSTHPTVTLNEMIEKRIGELEKDEKEISIKGRKKHLRQFRKILRAAQEKGCKFRSSYDLFLDSEYVKEKYSREVIGLFRSIVHRCYIVSNGFRSCDTVYVEEMRDELCLHGKTDYFRRQMKPGIASVDFFFEQYIRQDYAIDPLIDWERIVDLALISRGVFSDNKIKAENRCHILQKETGLAGYMPDMMDVPILLEQDARTSGGVPHKVSVTKLQNARKVISDVYTN